VGADGALGLLRMPVPRLQPPRPLAEVDDVAAFRCGRPELDAWLQTALTRSTRTARTYVVCDGSRVAGYYCLAAGAVTRGNLATARARRNTPEDVPVIVIGRLAVDSAWQGHGIGAGLLRDALIRSADASRQIGVRAVLVHTIDDSAAGFYRRYGFVPSPINARTLMLPVETVVAGLGE
jgi:GNAT superfamily N-acetyltransferase